MQNRPWLIRLVSMLIGLLAISAICAQPVPDALQEKVPSFSSGAQEVVYLHLNKTHFFKGEHLWYTAYAYDLNRKAPAGEALNAYVGVYNQDGQEVLRETVYLEQGIGHSQIYIDSTWTDSIYVIRAGTLRSNAIPSQGNYEQQIRVLQESIPSQPEGGVIEPVLEVVPEGGTFLAGIRNAAVVRLSGIPPFEFERTELWLSNSAGTVVVSAIPINNRGFAKFEFTWEAGQRYTLNARLANAEELNLSLPKPEISGVVFRLNTLHPEYIFLSVDASPDLSRETAPLYWALQQGTNVEFQLLDLEEGRTQKRLERSDLPEGINAVTIFDARFRPLAQRLFYNTNDTLDPASSIAAKLSRLAGGDSLQIELSGNLTTSASLSISILPADTRAYTPQHSLVSALAFRPYLRAAFKAEEVRHSKGRSGLFDLDLFMVYNGAGRYKGEQISPSVASYAAGEDAVLGFSGRVPDADLTRENQVWGVTDLGKNTFVVPLGPDKTFGAQAPLYQGDTLRLSLMGKNGRLRKASLELDWELPNGWDAAIEEAGGLIALPATSADYSGNVLDFSRESLTSQDPRTIDLEEVEVSAQRDRRYIPINSAEFSGRIIGENEIKRIPTLAEYLRRQGFKPRWVDGQLVVLSRTKKPGPIPTYVPVPVYVNGMISDGSALNIPLSNVARIFYDNPGRVFISVVLRTQNFYVENRERYSNFPVNQGYARPITFRNPLSWNVFSDAFRDYGQVHWVPKLELKPGEDAGFRFPDSGQKELLLVVEGLADDGRLISRTILVELPAE